MLTSRGLKSQATAPVAGVVASKIGNETLGSLLESWQLGKFRNSDWDHVLIKDFLDEWDTESPKIGADGVPEQWVVLWNKAVVLLGLRNKYIRIGDYTYTGGLGCGLRARDFLEDLLGALLPNIESFTNPQKKWALSRVCNGEWVVSTVHNENPHIAGYKQFMGFYEKAHGQIMASALDACFPNSAPLDTRTELGKGSFGRVVEGEWFDPKTKETTKAAIKIALASPTRDSLTTFRNESYISALLPRHDNIIKILGIMTFNVYSLLYPVITMAHGGERLKDYFVGHSDKKSDMIFKVILIYGAFCGIKALHDARIIHGDVAPANALVSPEGGLKWCDFGFSRHYQQKDRPQNIAYGQIAFNTPRGCAAYLSRKPLSLTFNAACEKESYAVGMVAYYTLTGDAPFESIPCRYFTADPNQACADYIVGTIKGLRWTPKLKQCGLFADMIKQHLSEIPEARPMIDDSIPKIQALLGGFK